MAKLTLPTLTSGYLDVDQINAALRAIEAFADTVLSRDGVLPNQMDADIDLNGHSLLNTVASDDPQSLVTRETVEEIIQERASGLLVQRVQAITATASQTVFNFTDFSYTPGANNLAVFVNGVRKFPGTDYLETNSTRITFLVGLSAGQVMSGVCTEFLGTVVLPTHTHTWTQITNIPDFATRWPTWDEVTGKPTTFTPATHQHSTADITSGNGLADARRGVWVQATQPTATRVGDLWFW